MYTVIGGEADGQTYSRLYNALEGIKKAEGWSQCWTSDPYPDEAGSRLYVYPDEDSFNADESRAGVYVRYLHS
jgi:hypothetical protein